MIRKTSVNSGADILGTITNAGVVAKVGTTNLGASVADGSAGLAYLDGVLYGVLSRLGSSADYLHTIDTTTGVATELLNADALNVSNAFTVKDGRLFVWDNGLVELTKEGRKVRISAQTTTIATMFVYHGVLYGVSGSYLYTISDVTGVAEQLSPILSGGFKFR